jgi:hypothetical protein
MIYDKARMAKLSGLMVESKGKGIKNPMADQYGGGDPHGDPLLDGEVSTAEHDLHEGDEDEDEGMMHMESSDDDDDEGMKHMEARRKSDDDDMDEEKAVRNMIRTELRKAKKDMDDEKREEQAVREAVRKEIRSVLKSRGVSMGGVGPGFKR